MDVELNQNLRVNSVRDVSGKPVSYDRDDNSGLKLHITLDRYSARRRKSHAVF